MKTTAHRIFHVFRASPGRFLSAGLLLLLLATLSAGPVLAQQRVNILEASSLTEETVDGEPVQKILGDVHLRMGNFEMYCDSAYRFLQRDEVRAYGNIEIITEEERIWADTLAYFTDIDFSQLRGRVIIQSDSTTLFGRSVDYRFSTKVGHFLDGVRLEDPQGVLRAQSGFYYREADSAVFRGQVQLADSTQYLEGDSLFTNRSKQSYRLYGQIYARDSENRSTLKGHYLEADSTGRRLLREDAWLRRVSVDTVEGDSAGTGAGRPLRPDPIPRDSAGIGAGKLALPDSLREVLPDSLRNAYRDSLGGGFGLPESLRVRLADPPAGLFPDTLYAAPRDDDPEVRRDTTHIRAREILMRRTVRAPGDTANTVDARDSVRVWSPRFSSFSDSARYESGREIFELRDGPRAWYDNIQLSGPYIRARLEGGALHTLRSYPQPFVVQEDTSLGRLNQITGDTLTARFNGGALSRIRVNGNTRMLRYLKNAKGEPDGAIELTSAQTILLFEEGELVEMKNLGSTSGYNLAENEQTAERRLDGFRWEPELRPVRPAEPMRRRFGSIPVEKPFDLPSRYLAYLEER